MADSVDQEKLESSLARFFQKMKIDKPVLRNNFFFQIVREGADKSQPDNLDPEELAWSDTTNGIEGDLSNLVFDLQLLSNRLSYQMLGIIQTREQILLRQQHVQRMYDFAPSGNHCGAYLVPAQ